MKKFKFLILIIALLLMPALIACNQPENSGDPSGSGQGDQAPLNVKIDKTEITVLVGESSVIKAQTLTEGATVTWESSNTAICTVENGVVVGVSKGEAQVSATVDGDSVYCLVVVIARSNSASDVGYSIELNNANLTLAKGETFKIEASLKGTDGKVKQDATFTYSSSNSAIATVDAQGKIKANAKGNADITVKYEDGDNWVTAIVKVNVSEDINIEIEPIEGSIEINSTYAIVYNVFKGGVASSYPADKVTFTSSNTEIAEISGNNIITKKAGKVSITVEIKELEVKSIYEFSVIDPDADPINLACEDIEIYSGSTMQIPVTGVSWGTLEYVLSDSAFSVSEDGKLSAPNGDAEATLTITHVETAQTVTVNVKTIVFDPCITTAKQFMALGSVSAGTSVYLGADIDLSAEEWSSAVGLDEETPNAEQAFLIQTLNASLDGKGYKITVRYDHNLADEVRLAGVFHTVSAGARVEHLVIDFEAYYYGPTGVDGSVNTSPFYGMMNGVLSCKNAGTVANNFVKARMYADNYVKREAFISYGGGTIKNNVVDLEVYKGGVAQESVGTVIWQKGENYKNSNNVLVNKYRSTAPGSVPSFYTSLSGFMSAWDDGSLAGKSTFTSGGWSVNSDSMTISLCDRVAHVQRLEGPALKVNTDSTVTWSATPGATGYKLQVKWSDESSWTNLPNTTKTVWSLTDYLKSIPASDMIDDYDGLSLSLRVATETAKGTSDYSEVKPMGNGAVMRVALNLDDLIEYTSEANGLNYTVLVDDIILDNVVKKAGTSFSVTGVWMQKGTLNGLGNTISYVYDDTNYAPAPNTEFYGLFEKIGESHKVAIIDLRLEAEITSNRDFDDMHLNLLARQLQGEMYNCYFKLRGYTTKLSATSKSRMNLVRRLVSSSTGEYTGSFDNCVFDMVTYGRDGATRQGGISTTCDTMISRNEANIMTNSGTGRAIRNCSFIMNQTQDRTVWSEGDSNVTIKDSAFFASFADFAAAWNNGTLKGKENYVAAGWSVSGTKVSYNGDKVN